jgi:hypothetical protein
LFSLNLGSSVGSFSTPSATNDADMKPQPSVITLVSLLGEVAVVVDTDVVGVVDAVVITVEDKQSSITDI